MNDRNRKDTMKLNIAFSILQLVVFGVSLTLNIVFGASTIGIVCSVVIGLCLANCLIIMYRSYKNRAAYMETLEACNAELARNTCAAQDCPECGESVPVFHCEQCGHNWSIE